jgi:predicted metalloenzyme YecM
MTIDDLLGDYKAFFMERSLRLRDLGMDIEGCAVSHLAFRTGTRDEYLAARTALEVFCSANVENVWNGRPISKLLLAEPLRLGAGFDTCLVELLPPPHRAEYRMGLEHVGIVIGDTVDAFAARHSAVLTGQQHQNEICEPYFVTFEDHSNVKFYRYSLQEVIVRDGRRFDGFYHVDGWQA